VDGKVAGTKGLIKAFQAALGNAVLKSVYPFFIFKIWELLNPTSQEYYRRTREASFGGKKLEEIQVGDEEGVKIVKGALDTVSPWYDAVGKEGKESIWICGGNDISYADVVLAGALICVRIALGEDSKEWEEIKGLNGGRWERFMEGFVRYETVV